MLHRRTLGTIASLLMLASLGAAPALGADPFSAGAAADQYVETVPGAGDETPPSDPSAGTIAAIDTRNCVERPDPGALASVLDFGAGPGGPVGTLGVGLPLILAMLLIAALLYALGRRRRAGAALALLCLAALGTPTVSQAAVELGVATGRTEGEVLSQAEFERLRLGGAKTVRASIDWEVIQPEKGGAYDFAYFDRVMRWASSGPLPSIEVLPILFASPAWVKGIQSSNEPPATKADLRAWARFVQAAVQRYGTGGEFWAENAREIESGGLRYNPVTAWQVWNEPNLSPFWSNAEPDAREYAELLEVTDEAIKRVEPRARTVLAGMLERADAPLPMSKFLAQLYKSGARKHFDVLAPQPFAFVDERPAIDDSLRRVRELADRNGDEDKPIWITEFGVASAGPKTPLTTDEQGQAAVLRGDLALIQKRERDYGIEKALWFQWRDADTVPAENKDNKIWQTYTGLFTYEGEPKAAWQAFCAIARGAPGESPLP